MGLLKKKNGTRTGFGRLLKGILADPARMVGSTLTGLATGGGVGAVRGAVSAVVKENKNSPEGGEGKPDKVRMIGTALFVAIFVAWAAGWLPEVEYEQIREMFEIFND